MIEDKLEDLMKIIDDNFKKIEKQNEELLNRIHQLEDSLDSINTNENKTQDNDKNNEEIYYLYYVTNGNENRFKIGITKNLYNRLSSLQSSNHEPIKLITKVVDYKEKIISLEKNLKEKMQDFNVSGEWFEMDYKKRQSLLDYLNKLNITDDSNTKTLMTGSCLKNHKKKLSKMNIEDIIHLFKEKGLKRKNNSLIFFNSLTNCDSNDYEFFLEKLNKEVENDLSNQQIKNLFKRLNNEYISCFDFVPGFSDNDSIEKTIKTEYPEIIKKILKDLNLDYVEQLSFIKFPTLYNHLIRLGYKLTKPQLKEKLDKVGMKVNNMSTRKNNKNVTSAILPKDNELKNKLLKTIQENLGFDLLLFNNNEIENFYNINSLNKIKSELKNTILEFKNINN